MSRGRGKKPKFSLALVQKLARDGCFRITLSAQAEAEALLLKQEDVLDCICELTERDYEQTLTSTKIPGTFQDVYTPRYGKLDIYLKVRLTEDPEPKTVIVSFKQNMLP